MRNIKIETLIQVIVLYSFKHVLGYNVELEVTVIDTNHNGGVGFGKVPRRLIVEVARKGSVAMGWDLGKIQEGRRPSDGNRRGWGRASGDGVRRKEERIRELDAGGRLTVHMNDANIARPADGWFL